MSELVIYSDLLQGTDEWLEVRRGMLTASAMRDLVTPTLKVANNPASRGITATLVAERVTGHIEEVFVNADMERGIENEPIARDYYAEHFAPVAEVGFMVREFDGFSIGYSPDGLVGDDGLIEIKSPRQKTHLTTILNDQVPDYYMAQCQTGLLVSGRKWIDFISFNAGMPLWVKRVLPDPAWQAAITDAARAFEEAATEMASNYLSAAKPLHPTSRIYSEMVI